MPETTGETHTVLVSPPKRPHVSGLAKQLLKEEQNELPCVLPARLCNQRDSTLTLTVAPLRPTVERFDFAKFMMKSLSPDDADEYESEEESYAEAVAVSQLEDGRVCSTSPKSLPDHDLRRAFFLSEKANSELREQIVNLEAANEKLRLQISDKREELPNVAVVSSDCASLCACGAQVETLEQELQSTRSELESLRADRDNKDNIISTLRRQLYNLGIREVQGIPTRGFLPESTYSPRTHSHSWGTTHLRRCYDDTVEASCRNSVLLSKIY
mmetsp:Transcript_40922/g.66367  ORF Transcript_40922/g.66367 Transcript_40922/m.66367 type:complete len:271 (+) Transcript_40922:229-1041(+)|eukprot:CAMPEP_0184666990 /NCGR_PEP_ID=MMETSP0308-20130426/64904_1 /TAXON_ID=38269 /ORGANISM="Gloeochaete witrockiana, Strain SAG 46.84" /LENGTH=270 /DNA_ID=CAMNT_0027111921 /DNA_START=132 /DNA_END=944 /DNA_ORIENTATION=+